MDNYFILGPNISTGVPSSVDEAIVILIPESELCYEWQVVNSDAEGRKMTIIYENVDYSRHFPVLFLSFSLLIRQIVF